MKSEVIESNISNIKYKLAVKLAETRKSNGLTQKEMAEICKTNQGNYSKIENGRLDSVSIDQLIKMNYRADTGLKLISLAK